MPAAPASAEPRAKLRLTIRRTFIAHAAAISRSWLTARRASPSEVRVRKSQRATSRATVTAITRTWGAVTSTPASRTSRTRKGTLNEWMGVSWRADHGEGGALAVLEDLSLDGLGILPFDEGGYLSRDAVVVLQAGKRAAKGLGRGPARLDATRENPHGVVR